MVLSVFSARNSYFPKSKARLLLISLFLFSLVLPGYSFAAENLFDSVGPPEFTQLPNHAVGAQQVKINRRALQAPSIRIDIFGQQFEAVRDRVERHKKGELVWVGHLQGNPLDSVILTIKGTAVSGFIQHGQKTYKLGIGIDKGNKLFEIDLQTLPPDDAGDLPQGDATISDEAAGDIVSDNVIQELLVVYNQGACNQAGGCPQLEADIVTAVADMNSTYLASGVNIHMNLAGTALTNYTSSTSSQALSDLRGTSDGKMDEVHALRDQLGADLVAFVYDGPGCGIGYLNSGASTAFSVTAEACLVGNRTMAHEIGHNQGAHHDRQTLGGGSSAAYNYGFRRCNDGSVDDFGSPFFRTVLSYSCSSAPRVGRLSNPAITYQDVPQGVDPAIDAARGAWNSKVLNNRATTVAGFRSSSSPTPPMAPSTLSALSVGFDAIDLSWNDNADNEDTFVVQTSTDGSNWGTIANLSPDTNAFQHDGLEPESTHFYRVRADNGSGSSGYSNISEATTEPMPAVVEDLAQNDVFISGNVSGTFTDTHFNDNTLQTITEQSTGGPKNRRKQFYTHGWDFNVLGGAGGTSLTLDAWVSGSEAADFYYSIDGGTTLLYMFTVDNTSQTNPKTFMFPSGTQGFVRIEAMDSESLEGESQDKLFIDHLAITSYVDAGAPPSPPTDLVINDTTSGTVSMQFQDNSEDEFGFEIWRDVSPPGSDCNAGISIENIGANIGTGIVTYVDTTPAASTSYWYWAQSFNAAGNNGQCSNVVQATTLEAPPANLLATPYKVRGLQNVDLNWSGLTGSQVDIYRNGTIISTVSNQGSHTDNIGEKGGGSYVYSVCLAGSTSTCTPQVTVTY